MIIEKLKDSLLKNGFQNSKVNVENIYLFYTAINQEVHIVVLLNCPTGYEFTSDQILNIKRQLHNQYMERFSFIQLHCIILTKHVDVVRNIWSEDTNHWIIDSTTLQLIVYENQSPDFYGVKKIIEDTLNDTLGMKDETFSDMNSNSYDPTDNSYNMKNEKSDNTQYRSQYNYNNDYENDRYKGTGNRQYNEPDNRHYNDTNNRQYNEPDNRHYNDSNNRQYSDSREQNYSNRTSRNRAYPPISNYFSFFNTLMVIINVLVYLILDNILKGNEIISAGALYWPSIVYDHEYYRVFTYMFLHFGMEHISNNMLVLFVIGNNLERAAGKWRYLFIYFGAGLIAGIASMSYNMLKNTNVVSVGASGAIFGVVGATAYIVAINKGQMENLSTRQIILFAVFSLYGGLTSQGVDNAAHIGGLLAGILLAAILYRKQKKNEPGRG
jgi:rhomboid protease GluP